MNSWIKHPSLVPFDGSFQLGDMPTAPPEGAPDKREAAERLQEVVAQISSLQRLLFAQNTFALLALFQGMDASGKDGTIRAVFSGVDPAGCQVYSFKRPSEEELDHDFLWRTSSRMPERGRIGVFNRSYYEEVLVVRVHPEILLNQKIPGLSTLDDIDGVWHDRFESIRDSERHLARNGIVVVKFWLHLSPKEQAKRLLERLDDPTTNWKFELGDLDERELWQRYQNAAEKALSATSRPWAPWYAVPADNKANLRLAVAEILLATLQKLDLRAPEVGPEQKLRLMEGRARLISASD